MSIREIESLVAIAEHGSITAAAERIFLSVPAVSAHMASLEAALKTPLLDRRYKPARLNAVGLLLSKRAKGVIGAYRALYEVTSDAFELAGTLVLGASPTVLTSVIPRTLVKLRQTHPKIQVRMHYGRSRALVQDLQHGELDAVLCSEPQGVIGDTKWTAVAQESIVVIAPPDAKGRTYEALLSEYPYVRFGKHFWVGDTIAAYLASYSIVPRQIMEVDSREAIAMMVRHGLGMSIVPQSDPPLGELYGLVEVPFGRPALTRSIGLAEILGSPKQALVDALLRALKQATVVNS